MRDWFLEAAASDLLDASHETDAREVLKQIDPATLADIVVIAAAVARWKYPVRPWRSAEKVAGAEESSA